MRGVKRLIPRSKKALAIMGSVVLVVVLLVVYFLSYAMPRSRADQMITGTAPSLVALNNSLGLVSADLERQKSLYLKAGAGMTNDLATSIQSNARDGRLAAMSAEQNLWQVALVVNSYGRSVQVGGMPVLFGDAKVSFAQASLAGKAQTWQELSQTLHTVVLLFDQAEKTAPIMRDFLTYQPGVDLGTHIDVSTKPVVTLRADRTLAALDMSITQISQLSPPQELWAAQERWLKQFVIARALLTELEQYVIADDFQGADVRIAPYAKVVHDLQDDMVTTTDQVWSQLAAARTLQQTMTWLPGAAAYAAAPR